MCSAAAQAHCHFIPLFGDNYTSARIHSAWYIVNTVICLVHYSFFLCYQFVLSLRYGVFLWSSWMPFACTRNIEKWPFMRDVTWVKFPKDSNHFKRLIRLLRRADNINLNRHSRVCSRHFDKDQIRPDGHVYCWYFKHSLTSQRFIHVNIHTYYTNVVPLCSAT